MASDKASKDTQGTVPADTESPPRYEGHPATDGASKEGDPQRSEASSSTKIQQKSRPRASKNKSFVSRVWGTVSRSRQETRTTIMSNIRRMMHDPHATSLDWINLLQSCENACSESSLSLSYLLQEPFIEEHTPLYWAIVKRDEGDPIRDPDLITILMSHTAPLAEPAVTDIYCACIVTSNQHLFQSLHNMPDFSSLMSGTDRLLLSSTNSRDQVTVEDVPGVNGSFLAVFEIAQFQKRMSVSREITFEFIARGRMWRLMFFISTKEIGRRPRGSWCISLCLIHQSPPTFIDGKFVIDDLKPVPITPVATTSASRSRTQTQASSSTTSQKSSIVIPCKSYSQLFSTTSSKHKALIMGLEDSPIGTSIQYKGTTFIAPDETLRFRLHARLCRSAGRDPRDDDCVIC